MSHDNQGELREPINLSNVDLSSQPQLPLYYSVVPPADIYTRDVTLLKSELPVRPRHDRIHGARVKDQAWLDNASDIILKSVNLNTEDTVTWAGFNSSLIKHDTIKPNAIMGVLPLFPDKAASIPMVKHTMNIGKSVTEFLNPGQTPVLGMDQPIFALGKQIQWRWDDSLGEDKYVLMLGALHIEFVIQAVEGKVTDGSGFASVISEAGVLTSGRAESVTHSSTDHHLKRTRYVHQVFLMAGSILKKEAYSMNQLNESSDYDSWDSHMRNVSRQFSYWSMILDLEQLHCRFVRSLREGDFDLYVQVIDELCGWLFVFDQTNYSRWLPIHVRDMVELEWRHPEVLAEFRKGNFVVQKSQHKFSLIPKDQNHEQMIKTLKGSSGVSSLFDNPGTMDEHLMSLPGKLQALDEFESSVELLSDSNSSSFVFGHHEEGQSLQTRFSKDVKSLLSILRDKGNPFLFDDTCSDLITLDTREVMPSDLADIFCNAFNKGKNLHKTFVEERLINGSVSITDTIKRVSLPTFVKHRETKGKKSNICVLKQNTSLVSHLFIFLQSRPDADIDDFFKFENQKEPPSLSDKGKLRSGKKSDIIECLKISSCPMNDVSMKILDAAAIVHMVRPTKAANFQQYVERHFFPFVQSMTSASTITRLDLIWDTYPDQSLERLTQEKRGASAGCRTKVQGSTPIPSDWKVIVHPSNSADLSQLMPCDHIEADSRIFLHIFDAAHQGHSNIYIRTVDSDIVVIAVSHFTSMRLTELWVGFGSGKTFQTIPIHAIVNKLGPQKCISLPLFHSYTGCDTSSSFLGIGKKTAWAAWEAYPEITDTFMALAEDPLLFSMDSIHMERLERWTVIMYSKSCGLSRVNDTRRELFTSGKRTLENIPPTQRALFQHTRRALYQAGYIWRRSIERQQNTPSPSEWGWVLDEQLKVWNPFWTVLADVSKGCALLQHCNCQKACKGNCKCVKANLRCTHLCHCEGGCINNDCP